MQGLLTGAATAAAAAERESAALKEARRVAGGRIGDWTTSSFAKTALDGLYAGSSMGGDRNRVLGHAGLLGSFSAVVNEALTLRDLTGGQAGAAFRALRQQVEAGSTPSVIERAMRASHTAVFPAMRPPRASEIGSVIEGVLSELKPRPKWASEARHRLGLLPTPWVRCDLPESSLTAMTRLEALDYAVRHQDPASAELNERLMARLGDYEDDRPPAAEQIDDPIHRTGYQLERGLDPALTILPTTVLSLVFAPFDDADAGPLRLDPDELENAVRMALKRIEHGIRRFLVERLTAAYGEDWIERLPGPMRNGWRRARQKEIDAGRQPSEPIAYADIEDYVKIIEHQDRWSELFEPVFRDVGQIRSSLRRIAVIRNPGANFRPVTLEDLIVLSAEGVHLSRWFGFHLKA